MSDITYSALIITISILVQFTMFDFSNLILISVIQYRKLLQHIGSIFLVLQFWVLLSDFIHSFMRFS